MAEAASIQCPSCGKRYASKPELAGRRVKCKCGGVISVPAAPPEPEPEESFDWEGITEEQASAPAADHQRSAPSPAASPAPSARPSSGAAGEEDTWKWWYYVAAGVGMIALGIFEYGRLTDLEEGRVESIRVNRMEKVVYELLGATGVLALIAGLGVLMLGFGIRKFLTERKTSG